MGTGTNPNEKVRDVMSDQINEQERFDNTMRRIASIVFLFGIFLYVLSIRSEMKHMTTSLKTELHGIPLSLLPLIRHLNPSYFGDANNGYCNDCSLANTVSPGNSSFGAHMGLKFIWISTVSFVWCSLVH
jgi:uncharacterized membrane protein YdfJ with MMPL/SSD domain